MSLVRVRRQMRYLMIGVWVFVAIFVLSAVFMYAGAGGGRDYGRGGANGLLARINGEDVTMGEFAGDIQNFRQRFASGGITPTLSQQAEIPSYAYRQILGERAQAAAARAMGVSVSSGEAQAEAQRQVEERIATLGAGLKQDELEQLRSQLMAAGMSNPDRLQRSMLAQRLQDAMTKKARPVEVRVAQVLIKTDTRTELQAERQASDISRRARAGEDFGRLVQQYSEDLPSKVQGGAVGWVGAVPSPPPTGKDSKPDPNAVVQLSPELTSAALRLSPGQVSDPVRSTLGYYVVKVLQERPYEPKEKDPKKRQDAIQQYVSQAGSAIAGGLFQEYESRAKVEPISPWLKGYLAEQDAQKSMMASLGSKNKPPSEAQRLAPALKWYQQALDENGPVVDAAFAYKVANLYQQANQPQQALRVLEAWTNRSTDPELSILYGEVLEKVNRKTDAFAAYKSALDHTYNNAEILGRLADKFKGVGHPELAKEASNKQAELTARQEAERKKQEEAQKKAMAEFANKGKKVGGTQTITLKGGNAPAKGEDAGNAPAANAPAAGNKPAASAPASAAANAPAAAKR